ncbi:hypothetical protein IPM19_02995 [bacterium]|nr:MAG: hypothetical protein IPM19_02995 [bacterium]
MTEKINVTPAVPTANNNGDIPVFIKRTGAPLFAPGFQPPDYHYILASNGPFVHKRTSVLDATVKVKAIGDLAPHRESAEWLLPKLPLKEMIHTAYFFKMVYEARKAEAMVLIYYSLHDQKYFFGCPEQDVSGGGISYKPPPRKPGYLLVGSIHSHAGFAAYHSGTDTHDEINFDGLHVTLGNMDWGGFSVSSELSVNASRFKVKPEDVIDGLVLTSYGSAYQGNTLGKLLYNIKKAAKEAEEPKPVETPEPAVETQPVAVEQPQEQPLDGPPAVIATKIQVIPGDPTPVVPGHGKASPAIADQVRRSVSYRPTLKYPERVKFEDRLVFWLFLPISFFIMLCISLKWRTWQELDGPEVAQNKIGEDHQLGVCRYYTYRAWHRLWKYTVPIVPIGGAAPKPEPVKDVNPRPSVKGYVSESSNDGGWFGGVSRTGKEYDLILPEQITSAKQINFPTSWFDMVRERSFFRPPYKPMAQKSGMNQNPGAFSRSGSRTTPYLPGEGPPPKPPALPEANAPAKAEVSVSGNSKIPHSAVNPLSLTTPYVPVPTPLEPVIVAPTAPEADAVIVEVATETAVKEGTNDQ